MGSPATRPLSAIGALAGPGPKETAPTRFAPGKTARAKDNPFSKSTGGGTQPPLSPD